MAATIAVVLLLVAGIGGAINLKLNGKNTHLAAHAATSTTTTELSNSGGPSTDPATTTSTVAPTTVPPTTASPTTAAPTTVAPVTTTTTTAVPHPPPPTTARTTLVPHPPTTPPTVPPTTAPPPTCKATMGSATPAHNATDTVSVTSNVAHVVATIIVQAGAQRDVVVTDSAGSASFPIPTSGFTPHVAVAVAVYVGGQALCATSFTPQ